MSAPPRGIVTDIEGTTTRIAFVHDVLFPLARARLPGFCARHAARPDVAPLLAEVAALAPGADPVDTLLLWMARDEKITPLKTLQGLIWREAYAEGAVQGEVFADVPPALAAWRAAGARLFVYSSGSVEAQRLLFGHTGAGDLTPLFDGFFDTAIGGKKLAASYTAIAEAARLAPASLLFLSDAEAELVAARDAGLRTCQLVRAGDPTQPAPDFPRAADFTEVAAQFALPPA